MQAWLAMKCEKCKWFCVRRGECDADVNAVVSGGMNHEDEDRGRIKICDPMSKENAGPNASSPINK